MFDFHALYSSTDPADFSGQSEDGTLQSAGNMTCLLIAIENDNIEEPCEEFSVSLSLLGSNVSPRITMIRSEPLVTILDDEGTCIFLSLDMIGMFQLNKNMLYSFFHSSHI